MGWMTTDDMELVREYTTRQSESAFAALRQARHPQLAEEVNWVHGVDHRPSRWFAPIGEICG